MRATRPTPDLPDLKTGVVRRVQSGRASDPQGDGTKNHFNPAVPDVKRQPGPASLDTLTRAPRSGVYPELKQSKSEISEQFHYRGSRAAGTKDFARPDEKSQHCAVSMALVWNLID